MALATRKRDVSLAALAPMYASMTVLFVSPIVMCRYALPVFADRVGKVGVSEANRDGFEGKRPSP